MSPSPCLGHCALDLTKAVSYAWRKVISSYCYASSPRSTSRSAPTKSKGAAVEQHQAEVAESQPVARLGHELVREVSWGLKLKIPSISDNDGWFETHYSLMDGALRDFKNCALIPFFCNAPNPSIVAKVSFYNKIIFLKKYANVSF